MKSLKFFMRYFLVVIIPILYLNIAYAKKHKLTVYRINKIEKGLSRSDKLDILIQPRAAEVAFVLRKRANLKVMQLGKLLKVSKQTILNREAGRRSPIPNIEFLIDYLKMEEITSDKWWYSTSSNKINGWCWEKRKKVNIY